MAKSAPFSRPNASQTSQLRIIGGQWRGRKLSFPAVDGLRPTGDRIRETLFNWLAPDLPGARCLDVFAGSGALGLECLSRGAAFSLLLERDHQAASALRSNLQLLQANNGQLVHSDSLNYLRQDNQQPPFEVVFIDPPFAHDLWHNTIDALEQGNWLAPNACIYVEAPRDLTLMTPTSWQLHRDKQAGQVSYRLYYRQG